MKKQVAISLLYKTTQLMCFIKRVFQPSDKWVREKMLGGNTQVLLQPLALLACHASKVVITYIIFPILSLPFVLTKEHI